MKKMVFYMEKSKLKRISVGIMLGLCLVASFASMKRVLSVISYSVNGRNLPIYCVETTQKKVALSFDAAWDNEQTEELLRILEKNNVHATFFMTGGFVERYPEDVKCIYDAGHEIGNHSMNHKNMSQLSKAQQKEEINEVHELVKEITGAEMKLFRPPYGDYDNTLIDTVNECGYYAIQWDVDSLDWKDYGADSIINCVCGNSHLNNGSIILMHLGAKYTPDALDGVICGLKEKGYEIVPVSELIIQEEYYLNHEGRQIKEK